MATDSSKRAIVVGAGPAGLTVAIALRRGGVQADVFEQAPEPRRSGLGLGIQCNAMRALEQLGLGGQLREKGVVVNATELWDRRGRRLLVLPQGEVSERFGAPTISLARSDLHDILVDALGVDEIRYGSRCVAVEQDAAGVTVRFADGGEERGALVIGADGQQSVVAKAVLDDTELRYSGSTSWRCVVRPDSPVMPPDVGRLYLGRGKMNALFPLSDERVYVGFMLRRPAAMPEPADVQESLRGWFADFPAATQSMLDAFDPTSLVRADIFDRLPGKRWFNGRIVLVGDAIHPTTPFVGQGAGIAIEDSVVLAREILAAGGVDGTAAIETALRVYQQRRAERARWVVLTGRRRGRMFGTRNPALTFLRDRLLGALPESAAKKSTERLLTFEL